MTDGALPHIIRLHVQCDILPVCRVIGAAYHAIVAVDVSHQQEAQPALTGAVAELRQKALRIQGKAAVHRRQHGADAVQLCFRVHGVRQSDGIAAQFCRLPALGGQQYPHAVSLFQHIRLLPRFL